MQPTGIGGKRQPFVIAYRREPGPAGESFLGHSRRGDFSPGHGAAQFFPRWQAIFHQLGLRWPGRQGEEQTRRFCSIYR